MGQDMGGDRCTQSFGLEQEVTAACAVWLPAYTLRDFGRSVKAALLLWQSTHCYLCGVVM